MELNEIRQRLELALRPAEPPTLEEVLEQVSTRSVLRGPVDWVFPAWIIYVEYAMQKIAETFPLSEEEKQWFHFRDALTRLLREAWMQTKEKLTTLYKAVAEGTYRLEGKRLYAPDGTWMYINKLSFPPFILIHSVVAKTRLPDLLKLPHERLELLQLGWRASDEGDEKSRPVMETTQPWQVFAWTVARYGALRIRIASAISTREGVSVSIQIKAKSWRQRWSKDEAVDLVMSHLKRSEWAPLLTAWLGDGKAERGILRSKYRLIISAKEPWRLGLGVGTNKALVATGREAFVKLREAAGVYGELLDLLKAHKWFYIKLATDDALRVTHKLKTEKRSIDVLREAYRQNNGEIPTEQFSHAEELRGGAGAVAGVAMYLHLVNGRSGSLLAKRRVNDVKKALAIAERLESAELRPNVVKTGPQYEVHIATADLLKLAEKDEAIRKAIALFLAEKVKNGTPRQREIAEKLLKRHPFFLSIPFCLLEAGITVSRPILNRNAELVLYVELTTTDMRN